MEKTKLTAIRKTWGDSRVTVYESEQKKLYVEFATLNDNNELVGCFCEIVQKSDNELMQDDYVAIVNKKNSLRHQQVEVDFNDRPRVASDWIQLHAIDTLRKRIECPVEDLAGYIG